MGVLGSWTGIFEPLIILPRELVRSDPECFAGFETRHSCTTKSGPYFKFFLPAWVKNGEENIASTSITSPSPPLLPQLTYPQNECRFHSNFSWRRIPVGKGGYGGVQETRVSETSLRGLMAELQSQKWGEIIPTA